MFELAAHLANRYPALPLDQKTSIQKVLAGHGSMTSSGEQQLGQLKPRDMDLLQVAREFKALFAQFSSLDHMLIEVNLRGVLGREEHNATRPDSTEAAGSKSRASRSDRDTRQQRQRHANAQKVAETRSKQPRQKNLQSGSGSSSVQRCPHCRHVIGPGMRHVCPTKDRPFDQRSSSVATVAGGGPGAGRKR